MAIPTEPIVFMKSISALTGPNDDVELPKIPLRAIGKLSWRLS